MRSCSYTRKNVHRKKKQGQEVSCIQNGMGVGGEPYIAYDPKKAVQAIGVHGEIQKVVVTLVVMRHCCIVPGAPRGCADFCDPTAVSRVKSA